MSTPQPQQAAPPGQLQPHAQESVPESGDGPGSGGLAPVTVRPAGLGDALRSEWTKIRSVRSTTWTLGVMLVVVVGIGLLTAWGLNDSAWVGMPLLAPGLFGIMLGQVCILTLGVLVITSEYGTGMIRTTFTACPRRSRVLTAKAVVFFLVAFVMTATACTITALVNWTVLSDQKVPPFLRGEAAGAFKDSVKDGRLIANTGEWLGATVGAALYVALLGLLALAVGALLRHSAGAITTMLGVVLLPLLLALFMQTESLKTVQEKLIEYSALNALASFYRIPMNGGSGNGWDMLGILAAVTAVVLGGAYALMSKRDV